MSSVPFDLILQRKLRYQDYARNGRLVDARFGGALAKATNSAIFTRGKEYFRWYGGLIPAGNNGNVGLVPGSNGTRVRWRFAGHSSPKVRRCAAEILVAFPDSTAFFPFVRVTLTD